ncbi:MAG: porin family protein [Flavobacteriaceae bacterium]
MKKIFLNLLMLSFLCTSPLLAQLKFGAKAGLNYDSLGDLDFSDVSLERFNSSAKTGFHFGLYANVNLLLFYLRPELQFSQSKSQVSADGSIALNKLEAPILLGYKILGPLSIFAGPSFQYILSEKGSKISLGDLDKDFTVGLQIGTRLQLGRFGLGLRYERGFSDNEVLILANNNVDIAGRVDARSKQWIISATYDLKLKKKSQ